VANNIKYTIKLYYKSFGFLDLIGLLYINWFWHHLELFGILTIALALIVIYVEAINRKRLFLPLLFIKEALKSLHQ
jgi:hypothetical protein